MEELSQHKSMVIAGDLNIHWDDPDSNETLLLRDTIEAIGLKQHVREFTHNTNHITDLLITESIGLIKVMQSKVAEFISDHQLVYMNVNINKPKNKTQKNQNKTNFFSNSGGILKIFQLQQNT